MILPRFVCSVQRSSGTLKCPRSTKTNAAGNMVLISPFPCCFPMTMPLTLNFKIHTTVNTTLNLDKDGRHDGKHAFKINIYYKRLLISSGNGFSVSWFFLTHQEDTTTFTHSLPHSLSLTLSLSILQFLSLAWSSSTSYQAFLMNAKNDAEI